MIYVGWHRRPSPTTADGVVDDAIIARPTGSGSTYLDPDNMAPSGFESDPLSKKKLFETWKL